MFFGAKFGNDFCVASGAEVAIFEIGFTDQPTGSGGTPMTAFAQIDRVLTVIHDHIAVASRVVEPQNIGNTVCQKNA